MLDVCLERIAQRLEATHSTTPQQIFEAPSKEYDEAERIAVNRSTSIRYRQRHNRMTNALSRILKNLEIVVHSSPAGRCDALVRNYDGDARDLLVEAKPDPDKGSIRIAIGQLIDYRRWLERRVATDLAVLTISRPEDDYLDLLTDLGITALWFGAEACKRLVGHGSAWPAIKASVDSNVDSDSDSGA